MIDARSFMVKINEIEKRMDYVIENWGIDRTITSQDIRFVLSAYLHELYENEKIKDLARSYLHRVKERKRLDFETLITSIASALVVNEDFSEYWNKLKERIDRSSPAEKFNLIVQFLLILTPSALRKINDIEYIKILLRELESQDTEKKLFSCLIEKILFSRETKITVSQSEIKHLKEYLLWELINSNDEHQKQELRNKFIPEILNYEVNNIDLIVFLIYQFLKKNKPIILTEMELNRKIRHEIKLAISKKLWFPLISSIVFVLIKLYLVSGITKETIGQVFILILGILLLFFEEKLEEKLELPEVPVKRYRVTYGQVGELLIILSILWALGLTSKIINFI